MGFKQTKYCKISMFVGVLLCTISLTGCTFAREVKKNDITGKLMHTALPKDTEVDKRENYF